MLTGRIPITLALVFSAVAAIEGIVIMRQSARLQAHEQQHDRDLKSREQLRAALPQQPVEDPPSAPPPEGRPAPVQRHPSIPETIDLSGRDAAGERLRRELDEARASIARLQGQLENSESERLGALAASGAALQKQTQEAQDRLDALQKQLEAARFDAEGARASRQKAASLDAENVKIKAENVSVSAHIAELRKAMASLQDLDRRRDIYLSSILSRYRDITEQFRAMKGTIDSSRASGSSSFSDVALSRIQTATSLAEDDLRRWNELNAQAHQIESRLAKN